MTSNVAQLIIIGLYMEVHQNFIDLLHVVARVLVNVDFDCIGVNR